MVSLVSLPLCFLLDPLDHVDEILEQLQYLEELTDPEQIRQRVEMLGGPVMDDPDAALNVLRHRLVEVIRFLNELQLTLGDCGELAVNAWWQGRLIGLLRAEAAQPPCGRRRAGQGQGGAVPDVFRDLIQGLDFDSAPPTGRY